MAWKLVIDVYCCFHFPLSHMSLFCSIPTRPPLVGFGCRPSAASLVKWWIAASLGAIAPQHSGEKSGCTTTRLYSVHNYIWLKPDWYRGAHFTASIHMYVALPCHFRCSCVVWVLCSFSLSVVPCAVWDASGVWAERLEKWSTTTVAGRWTAPPYSIIIITISLHHQMEHIISSS